MPSSRAPATAKEPESERQAAISSELLSAVRRIQLRASRVVNDVLAGQYLSTFRGVGMEFSEVRVYAPGDDVRSIDWNVTARTGIPHIKRYVEERELTMLMLVDVSASGAFGSSDRPKSQVAAELCALLALAATTNNDKVGLLLHSDQTEKFVPPKKGKKHVLRVIREVLLHTPEHRGTSLASGLAYLARVARRHATLFIVSDFLLSAADRQQLEAALRVASRRHDVVAVSLVDPREDELPAVGLVELEDLETGTTQLVDTGSALVRAAYAQVARRRHAARGALLRRLGVDEIVVDTSRDWIDPIVRFFRTRERRMSREGGG